MVLKNRLTLTDGEIIAVPDDWYKLRLPKASRPEVIKWLRENVAPQSYYLHTGWHGGKGWAALARTNGDTYPLEIKDEKLALWVELKWG